MPGMLALSGAPTMTADWFAISNAFGSPLEKSTWSGAPANVAEAIERRGLRAFGIDTSCSRAVRTACAGVHLLLYGRGCSTGEIVSRGMALQALRAHKVAAEIGRLGIRKVLHTGTFDLPVRARDNGIEHYLFCDHTWHLSYAYRPHVVGAGTARALDAIERKTYARCKHIFTFGKYVRDDLIDHYGVLPENVTAVGSGRGKIHSYRGPKDYGTGRLLFIAKHYFEEKGGHLLIEAFRIAHRRRPDLSLTVVGGAPTSARNDPPPNVAFRPFVPWDELEGLLREAALLAQPMLNDPWGQVYLEAMASRTPVLGLNRNGLPEIAQNGRYGFLVDRATPEAVADAILDALSNADRLAAMGNEGMRHVEETYSWERVGAAIFDIMAAPGRPDPFAVY